MTALTLCIICGTLAFLIGLDLLRYRLSRDTVRQALKTRGPMKGSDLVLWHNVRRGHVYVILAEYEELGLVERVGNRLPYRYRWIGG